MHEHSLAAYRHEAKRISLRAVAVYLYVKRFGRSTDREVMKGMGFTDPNKVRPRITELIEAKLLVEVGEKRDPETKKTVRIVDLAERAAAGAQLALDLPAEV